MSDRDTKVYFGRSFDRLPMFDGQYVVTQHGIFKCQNGGELVRIDNKNQPEGSGDNERD